MKKIFLLSVLCSLLGSAFAQDPVAMTIAGEDITLSEFNYIWSKNSQHQSIDSISFDDYIDMFVAFKLKVAAAKEAGLDTLDSFKQELAGYRAQLTPQYLKDEATEKALQQEAYQLMQTYVELSHILLPVADPAQEKDVYQQALDIRKSIMEDGKDFAAMAQAYSQDNSREKGGYLGTNIAARYIYSFARAAMQLEEGEVSMPVRTEFGYHLIKMHSRQTAIGQYLSGHIYKTAYANSSEQDKAKAKEVIFDMYRELQAGKSFEEVANSYRNDDRYVVGRDGKYPWLRGGSLPIEYEEAVALLKDGEYSRPFQSSYGWHIVKRYEVGPFPSIEDLSSEIDEMIKRDERSEMPALAFSEKLKTIYNFQPDEQNLQLTLLSIQERPLNDATMRLLAKFNPVATFDGQQLLATDFARFVQEQGLKDSNLEDAWKRFFHESLIAYEDSRLESKYPDFGHLMKEYHDGILLFEVSNRNVWNKAATDSAGLEKFYRQHRKELRWEQPRFTGVVVGCHDQSIVKEAKKLAKSLPLDSIKPVLMRTYNNDSISNVRVDGGVYFKGKCNPMVEKVVFNSGKWEPNGHYLYYFYVGKIQKQPKCLDDVRGQASAKYQDYLEAAWVASLKEKYPVVIYREVLDQLDKK